MTTGTEEAVTMPALGMTMTVDQITAAPVGTVIRSGTGNRYTKQADTRWRSEGSGRMYANPVTGAFVLASVPGTPLVEFRVGQHLTASDMEAIRSGSVTVPEGLRVHSDRNGSTFEWHNRQWRRSALDSNRRGIPGDVYYGTWSSTGYGVTFVPNQWTVGQRITTLEQWQTLPTGATVRWTFNNHDTNRDATRREDGRWEEPGTGYARTPEAAFAFYGSTNCTLLSLPGSSTGPAEVTELVERAPLTVDTTVEVPVERLTLRRFKQRFRTIMLARQQQNGTSERAAERALQRLEVFDVAPAVGCYLGQGDLLLADRLNGAVVQYDEPGSEKFGVFGIGRGGRIDHLAGPRRIWQRNDDLIRPAGLITAFNGQTEPEGWTTEVATQDDLRDIETWCREAWVLGESERLSNSYCGEYQRAMASAQVGPVASVSALDAAAMPEGTAFVIYGERGRAIVVRDDRADNAAKTRFVCGTVEGSWAVRMTPIAALPPMWLGAELLDTLPTGSTINLASYTKSDDGWNSGRYVSSSLLYHDDGYAIVLPTSVTN